MSVIDSRPAPERALVVHPARRDATHLRSSAQRLEEAVGLAQALDLDVVDAQVAPLRSPTPATLFGRGRVEALKAEADAVSADIIVVDDALSPVQQRNLEKALERKVVDRTGLILEIFARRARTAEGKLQVHLARLEYERSRLVRTWTHLERQRGGTGGTGGPGERQIELDRRQIADRIVQLKRQLEDVRRTRELHRSARKRTPYPVIALVGYTNAGKSTLFNRITTGGVLAKDMLFATLDPTLREVRLPGGRPAILSDTVGFISDLPHELVAAFRATLEEVEEADLVLHVRDISGEDTEAQAGDVQEVLGRIGFEPHDGRILEVWNKADQLDPELREAWLTRTHRAGETARAVMVSALTGEGCDALLAEIAARIDEAPPVDAHLRADEGEALAWLYRNGRVIEREDAADGQVRMSVRLDPQALGRFERRFPQTRLGETMPIAAAAAE